MHTFTDRFVFLQQTEFSLVPNQSEKCVINKIQKIMQVKKFGTPIESIPTTPGRILSAV